MIRDRDAGLYFKTEDLQVDQIFLSEEETKFFSERIISHQIAGLTLMGCDVNRTKYSIISSHRYRFRDLFLNRIFGLDCDEKQFKEIISNRANVSVEVNPLSAPKTTESILIKDGFEHTLSSAVLVKKLVFPNKATDIGFYFKLARPDDIPDIYKLFGNFFRKSDENVEDVFERLLANLTKGPHVICYVDQRAVGMAGAIILDKTASAYSTIIEEEFRSLPLALQLYVRLENAAIHDGADFIYGKSRNRAVVIATQKYLGMKKLYNERVYEKRQT